MYKRKIDYNTKKSQTATEYIIIVAVVIVIALVVVQIMGGFPGIGSSTSKKVSDYKLSSSDQIGIDKYYFGNRSFLATIKNNYFETLIANTMSVNGVICNSSNTNISGTSSPGLSLTLNPGQSSTISCSNSFLETQNNDPTPCVIITYTNPTTSATYSTNSCTGNNYANLDSGNQTQNISQGLTVSDLRQGLVAYYALDGNTSDGSGNNLDGNNTGANYTSSGKVGGAYNFNGVNSYINTANQINNNNYSISYWFKTSYGGGSQVGFAHWTDSSNFFEYFPSVRVDNGALEVWAYSKVGGVRADFVVADYAKDYRDNIWHNLVVIFENNSGKSYIDNNYLGSSTFAFSIWDSSNNHASFDIGRTRGYNWNGGPYYYFIGSMDEVAIYNRSLNSTEISFLYNNGTGQSLSLGGDYAPNCTVGQTNCSGTNYLTCSNGNWVNNGNVSGQCGYVNISALRTGLLAYYTFDGNTSDESGNNNHGTNYGANYTTLGKVGGAYTFDGISNYVNVPTTFTTNAYPNITYSFWAYLPNTALKGSFITDGANTDGFTMGISAPSNIDSSGNTLTLIYNGVAYLGTTTTMSTGWHHIVVILPPNRKAITYVDNVNIFNYTGSYSMSTSTGNIQIGRYSAANPRQFNGTIDEVIIWNRSLNSTEISYLFNNGTGLSLSLGGAYAPNCTVGQTNCSGTNYLNCSNGNWINNGDISGLCGYVAPANITQLRSGLVGYWSLDGNTSDGSGNNNDGTNYNANYTTLGKVGGAYQFDGINDYINLGNPSALNPTTAITLSAWIKRNSILSNDNERSLLKNNAYGISVRNGAYHFAVYVNGNWRYYDAGTWADTNWHHLVGTYDSTTRQYNLYKDGVNISTQTLTGLGSYLINAPVSNLATGVWIENSLYFNGFMDEVSIWNRALTSTEVTQLYNASNGLSISLSGPQTPVCGVGQTNCSGTNFLNCSNGNWVNLGNIMGQCGYAFAATGGTITYTDSSGLNPRSSPSYAGGYTVHTFTSSGIFNVTSGNSTATVLVVAGGGGGGTDAGGGGGAGGLVENSSSIVTINSYNVVVGNGGISDVRGGNSSFNGIIAVGGGAGAHSGISNGGSGGGASYQNFAARGNSTQSNYGGIGYGNIGGTSAAGVYYYGSGGGGAGAVGNNGTTTAIGTGGAGRAYSISGTSVTYAVGGNGGNGYITTPVGGENGNSNSGNGANAGNGGMNPGGTGGSGIVIIRYLS